MKKILCAILSAALISVSAIPVFAAGVSDKTDTAAALEEGTYAPNQVVVMFKNSAIDTDTAMSKDDSEAIGAAFGEMMDAFSSKNEALSAADEETYILTKSLGSNFTLEDTLVFDEPQTDSKAGASENAKNDGVDMRLYRVIYDCINEIEAAIKGMLAPEFKESVIGYAEVRETYKVSKVGQVCGCYVTEGKIQRGSKVRILRDNIIIHEGGLASLRRFKDDVKEVAQGYECGMQIEKFNDIKVGDMIECFIMEEISK